jgi:CysZ protein
VGQAFQPAIEGYSCLGSWKACPTSLNGRTKKQFAIKMVAEPTRYSGMLAGRLIPAPLYVLRGALFLWGHRVLWKYAAAPVAISLFVMGGAYVLLYHTFYRFFGAYAAQEWYWRVLYYALIFLLTAVLLVLFFFFFTRVASALASPFNDLISQKAEELLTGTYYEAPFSVIQLIRDSGRAIGHSFKLLGLYLILLAACLLLLLIPGVGGVLFSAAGWSLSAYMLAYEYLGYPMDRRRFSWNQKRAFIRSRFRATMGFGLGNLVAAAIPIVNLLFIPSAVVGGTLLFLELEPSRNRPADVPRPTEN